MILLLLLLPLACSDSSAMAAAARCLTHAIILHARRVIKHVAQRGPILPEGHRQRALGSLKQLSQLSPAAGQSVVHRLLPTTCRQQEMRALGA